MKQAVQTTYRGHAPGWWVPGAPFLRAGTWLTLWCGHTVEVELPTGVRVLRMRCPTCRLAEGVTTAPDAATGSQTTCGAGTGGASAGVRGS